MKKKLINLIFALLLIAGIAAQSSLLVGRALAENEDRAVAAAVYYEDIELLSRESGIGTEHWLNSFSQRLCHPGIWKFCMGQSYNDDSASRALPNFCWLHVKYSNQFRQYV